MTELASFSDVQGVQQQQRSESHHDHCRERRPWSLWCTFFLCLAACLLITGIALLILALLYSGHFNPKSKGAPQITIVPSSPVQGACLNVDGDMRFQFLNQLSASQVSDYTGGSIQCAGFRANASEYSSREALYFGTSIYNYQSHITGCTMTLRSGGLRVPNWNVNAHLLGFVIKGTVWVGIVDGNTTTTFSATAGQVIFVPQNRLYWIGNSGNGNASILQFYSTSDEIFTIDLSSALNTIPEEILSRTLVSLDAVRPLITAETAQPINLISNLAELIQKISNNSPSTVVGQYFFSLTASRRLVYAGGEAQWARYYGNGSRSSQVLNFGNSLNSHAGTLSLGSLVLHPAALLVPSYNLNANEMGYVVSGCGQVGLIGCSVVESDIGVGDMFFFPTGVQHYIRNTCNEKLLVLRAYSTSGKLGTFFLDDYFQAIPNSILTGIFNNIESESGQLPVITETVTILDPDENNGTPNEELIVEETVTILDPDADNIEHIAALPADSPVNPAPSSEMATILG